MNSSLIALLILICLMVTGVPVFVSIIIGGMYLIAVGGYDPAFLIPIGFARINSVTLLAMPMFIFAGSIMEYGGIGEKLVNSCYGTLGRIKGGIGIIVPVASAIFGALSGSSSATVSAIGTIMAPRLKENGYPEGITGAVIASSGVLGILIPPSMMMVLYGWVGNVSVLQCFLASVIPGIILTALLSIITVLMVRKNPNIKMIEKLADTMVDKAKEKEERRLRRIGPDGKRQWGVIPALLLPVIILGGIYGGFLTPTEAAAISCVYCVPVGFFIYRGLTWKTFGQSIQRAGVTTGIIMCSAFASCVISRMFTTENLPQAMLDFFTSVSPNPNVIMLMINIFMMLMGMIMSDDNCVLLCTPLLVPIISKIGFSPVHFASILALNFGMGNVTPPVAPCLYLAARIADVDVKKMMVPNLIYVVFGWLPVLAVTILFPQLSLWLPGLIMGT